jgi:hypothetical protein
VKGSLLTLLLAAAVAPLAQAMHAPERAGISTTATLDAATRHHHPDVVLQPPTRIITVREADTFDWGDAGIGAGAALGLVLVGGGSALLLRRDNGRKGVPVV